MSNKKWYSYFVVVDKDDAGRDPSGAPVAPGAVEPRRAGDLAPEPEAGLAFDAPVTAAIDLAVVYDAAKITPPAHGYTVLKVADMLESEHLKALPPDVKRKSILVALDAATVKVEEIVEDAVRRDRALDTYERVLEGHLQKLREQIVAENKQIEDEIARTLADLRARVDANRQKVESEEREFLAWRTRKHQEEELIVRTVGHFVSENPITTPGGSAKDKGEADVR